MNWNYISIRKRRAHTCGSLSYRFGMKKENDFFFAIRRADNEQKIVSLQDVAWFTNQLEFIPEIQK